MSRTCINIIVSCFLFAAISAAKASDDKSPQPATPADVKIFEPYIGTFRSESKVFDDGETEYHFTVSYQWYDKGKTIVKYAITMEIPQQGRTIGLSEGFYGYDAFNKNLYVFGAFTRGMTGWGTVGRFNHETGARETWARSMSPDNIVTYVRDTFQRIDADHWSNKTFIRLEGESDWKQVAEDQYTRLGD